MGNKDHFNLVLTEKVSFNADIRRLHTDGRRFTKSSLCKSCVTCLPAGRDLRSSAFKKSFSALTNLVNSTAVFSLIFLCLVYQVSLAASGVTLKFSLLLDKDEYKPNEPINLSFKLENKGKTAVYVNKRFYLGSENMAKEKRDVFLIVTSPSGAKLPCKFSYETGFPKSDYFVLLESGKEVISEYPRNLWGYFDFNEPGVYKVVGFYENVYGDEIGLSTFKDKITTEPVYLKVVE